MIRFPSASLLLLLLPLALAGCGHKPATDSGTDDSKTDAARPVVRVAAIRRETLEQVLPVTGVLQALPGQEAVLSPSVTGLLELLPVRYGQAVQRGQIVAQLSTRPLLGQIRQAQATVGQNQVQVQQAQANALQQQAQTRSSILQAQASVNTALAALAGAEATLIGDEAALRNAQQSLARAQTLFTDGLLPQKDIESAQLAVQTAQATLDAQRQTVDGQRQTVAGQRQAVQAARAATLQDLVRRKDIQIARQQVRNAQGALDTARSQQALYTLYAPLAGQVTVVGANIGETVDTTTKLVTVTNLDRLQLLLSLPGNESSQVRVGQRVTFTVDGLPGRTFQSVIVRVGSQVDPATGTVSAFAVVANTGHRLRDDTTVQARITTERRANVLTVPASAILTDPDTGKPTVLIVGTDEVARVTPVVLGLSTGGRVEIRSGVQAGQRVAISGQYGVPGGTMVTAQSADDAVPAKAAPATEITAFGSPGASSSQNVPAPNGASTPTPNMTSGTSPPTPDAPPSNTSAPSVAAPPASSGVPSTAAPSSTGASGGSSGSGSAANVH